MNDQPAWALRKPKSTNLPATRMMIAVLILGLLVSACQKSETASGEQRSTATPTVEMEKQLTLADTRPDAPTYAVRGQFRVGYQSLVGTANATDDLVIGSWYPAHIPEESREEVAYEVVFKDATWTPSSPPTAFGQALRDAVIDDANGPYPLVILSHSFSGNAAGYSSLAEHFASHGFIVLAPEHNEQYNPELDGLWKALIDRPVDVTRTLDFAEELASPDGAMSGLIDMDHVAVVGHSYGGYTALALAGARMDFGAFKARCGQLPEDDPAWFLCNALIPNEANMAARAGLDSEPAGLWPAFGDPRVTAIIPMAGDAYLFDEAGLSEITIPMLAMGGTADFGTPYDWGAQLAYDHASSEHKALVGLIGAEHMIFSTPCDKQPWLSEHPAHDYYCFDPVWDIDRAQDLIHHLSTAFLLTTLTGNEAAHLAIMPENVQFPGIEYTTTYK